DHPSPCAKQRLSHSCELENLAAALGVSQPRFSATRDWTRGDPGVPVVPDRNPGVASVPFDLSSPVIAVDHSACILCDRCIRGCDWIQVNDVIGRTGKAFDTRIAFDTDRPMGDSTCVSCGECMARCPTGALTDKALVAPIQVEKLEPVPSVCPYCGVGCGITMHVQEERVVRVTGRPEGPANMGRLCV